MISRRKHKHPTSCLTYLLLWGVLSGNVLTRSGTRSVRKMTPAHPLLVGQLSCCSAHRFSIHSVQSFSTTILSFSDSIFIWCCSFIQRFYSALFLLFQRYSVHSWTPTMTNDDWHVPVLGVRFCFDQWKIIPVNSIIHTLGLRSHLSITIQISTGFPVEK